MKWNLHLNICQDLKGTIQFHTTTEKKGGTIATGTLNEENCLINKYLYIKTFIKTYFSFFVYYRKVINCHRIPIYGVKSYIAWILLCAVSTPWISLWSTFTFLDMFWMLTMRIVVELVLCTSLSMWYIFYFVCGFFVMVGYFYIVY